MSGTSGSTLLWRGRRRPRPPSLGGRHPEGLQARGISRALPHPLPLEIWAKRKAGNYPITQSLNPYVASTAGSSSTAARPRTLAVVTSTTAATMITVPPTMYRFTLSCSTSQPRNTAITGFT